MIALALALRTLLVVPFAAEGDSDLAWVGMAAAETLLAQAAAAPDLNALSVRQLNTVLKRRDLTFADVSTPAEAAAVGVYLGATHAVVGRVVGGGPALRLEAQLVAVPGGQVLAEARAEAAPAQLPAALAALGGQKGDILLFDAPSSDQAKKENVPISLSSDPLALQRAAECLTLLLPQPLGPRARPVLAADLLAAARERCQAALALDPALSLARAGLAIALANAGDARQALAEARAAQAQGFAPLAVLAEYYALVQLGDLAGALAALEAAVQAHPAFLHARGYLGEHHNERKDHARALQAFEAYLARCPGHPWVMAQIGYTKARLGKIEESIAVTREALARDPQNAELAIELASRLVDAGRLEEAAEALLPALAADPPRPLANLRLGYVRLLQGRLEEAVPPLQTAIRDAWREDEFRTRGLAHFDLARIRARQGQLDEAVAQLQDAQAEGAPRTIPCAEPDLAALAADPRFAALCTKDAPKARPRRKR